MTAIREAIIAERLRPGQVYSVERIAREVKMVASRTPVREALVRLAEHGMVRLDRRGVQVVRASLRDLEELFQLRVMLEVPAAYRAARRADEDMLDKLEGKLDDMRRTLRRIDELRAGDEHEVLFHGDRLLRLGLDFVEHDTIFHELILRTAGNQLLVRTVRSCRSLITTTGAWRYIHERGVTSVMREHEPVFEALKEHNGPRAAHAMYDHLTETGTQLLEGLKTRSAEGATYDERWFEGVAVPKVTQNLEG